MAASPVEETAPVGPLPQALYLNQMLLLETDLEPRELLDALLLVEAAEGRIRMRRWGPRTLDCDIVLWHERTVQEPGLTIPHPELPNRLFWRRELAAVGITPGAGGW